MKFSLRTKTTLGIVLFALVLSTVAIVFSYLTYMRTMNEHYYEMGSNVVETVASQFTPEELDALYIDGISDEQAKELMNTPEYLAKQDFIRDMGAANDVKYLYVVRPLEQGAYYMFDADPDSETMCPLGYIEAYYPGNFSNNKEAFLSGRMVEPIISNQTFGWLLSAFYPITLDGKMVAYVCADISMDQVMTDRAKFLKTIVLILATITVVFMLLYLWLVNGMIVRPINQLSVETARFVAAKNGADGIGEEIRQFEIHTGDEIENLADAIKTMEEDIDRYIENLTQVTAEKERIGAELNVATQIQASMLPSIFPPFPTRDEFDLYATMNPAKEVGGDFYDFFLTDEDHLVIVIADVSGKGVPAALFMVIAKTLIKNQMQVEKDPQEVFNKVNLQLCENNEAGMFVTAWMGVLEISTGSFTYVNAGHNPPLLKRADGAFEYLSMKPGFVLAGFDEVRYQQTELQLYTGDILYLYTDGVVEATDTHSELYGDSRLQAVLNQNRDKSATELLKAVKKDVDSFVGEAVQFDDMTMLGLRIVRENQ
ncbi:MAG: SpoIIE family protein phosphatase [bacterium]|nr:SpoIIE family protein phosphatase [bacterium]